MNLQPTLRRHVPELHFDRLKDLSRRAARWRLTPYLVGGAVRDMILKQPFNHDLDVTFTGGALEPLARELAAEWKVACDSYPQFMTFTLRAPGFNLDLITARRETYAQAAALPTVFAGELIDDLRRRDFTVNAMAMSLDANGFGALVDPLHGLDDLRAKALRILHPKSFADDPTRIYRGARYAGRFGFKLDEGTLKRVKEAVRFDWVQALSRDRVRVELEKILNERGPATALELLDRWKVLLQSHSALRWNAEAGALMKSSARPLAGAIGSVRVNVRFALWLRCMPPGKAEAIMNDLHFERHNRETILLLLELDRASRENRDVTALPRMSVADEAREFCRIMSSAKGSARAAQWWKKWFLWQASTPQLDGEDLMRMGYAPGPLFRSILNRLALEKYKGKLKDREAEIRFVVDNFRRD